jgi:hypothetical protein
MKGQGDPLYQAFIGAIVGGIMMLVIVFVRAFVPPVYRWIIQFPLWKRRLIFWPVMLTIIGSLYLTYRP